MDCSLRGSHLNLGWFEEGGRWGLSFKAYFVPDSVSPVLLSRCPVVTNSIYSTMSCLLWCSPSTQAQGDGSEVTTIWSHKLIEIFPPSHWLSSVLLQQQGQPRVAGLQFHWQDASVLNEMIHWKEALAMMFGIEEHVTKAEENQASFSTYSVCLKSYPDADGSFSGALYLQECLLVCMVSAFLRTISP